MDQHSCVDIEKKLSEKEGGVFQRLCSDYLVKKGYLKPVNYGAKAGSDKTIKGVPDAYFQCHDRTTALVMYSSGETNGWQKIQDDVNDCLKRCSLEGVSQIVECHAFSRIRKESVDALAKKCKAKNVELVLFGIDE